MISNVSRLADMNEALTSGLAPYVRHRLEELLKESRTFSPRLPQRCDLATLDAHGALYAIVHNFDTAFKNKMGTHLRAAASSALAGRNALAHPVPPPDDNLTLLAIVGAVQLLEFVQAQPELFRICRHRDEIMIRNLGESRFTESPPKTQQPPAPAIAVSKAIPPRTVTGKFGAGNNGGFFVYENFVWKMAVVHHGDCSHCNQGAGRPVEKSARNGRWFGRFANIDDAWLAARITGQPDRRTCGFCLKLGAPPDHFDGIDIFDSDGAEYRDWIIRHPEGYVVNSRRRFDTNYVVLHRASCSSINSVHRSGYTERGYIKICALRLESLECVLASLRSSDDSFSKRCAICEPA